MRICLSFLKLGGWLLSRLTNHCWHTDNPRHRITLAPMVGLSWICIKTTGADGLRSGVAVRHQGFCSVKPQLNVLPGVGHKSLQPIQRVCTVRQQAGSFIACNSARVSCALLAASATACTTPASFAVGRHLDCSSVGCFFCA